MKLEDIMTDEVEVCSLLDNVYEVAVKMKESDVGSIPICEQGKLLGIITDRDIVVRGVAEKKPNSSKVEEVMTTEIFTAPSSMSINEAAMLMAENQIRRLPVVQGEKLIGVVSLGDLAKHQSSKHDAAVALSEISEQAQYHH